ncbi:alpha/beta hydrolase [Kiloniella sp. b19]|uniref:alpha/beta hydrolase n=1 Tax=Kiloniella sp. GXU_MW_B19 TaxID=3141326 RepID=UPI0031E02E88
MPDIILNGPEGRLEGRYYHSKVPNAPIAMMLHPHPQHGGTMNNRIVYTMFHAYVKMGFSVLRFNFRGVGRSQGVYADGEGELADAASALDWLQSVNENASQCWVAGFSFGAWIGMQLLMRRPEINGFVSIAPPANMFDFSFLAPCPSSGLILQGERDDVVPEASVAKLADKLNSQKGISIDYRLEPDAGHYFENQMELVEAHIQDYVRKRFAEDGVPLIAG